LPSSASSRSPPPSWSPGGRPPSRRHATAPAQSSGRGLAGRRRLCSVRRCTGRMGGDRQVTVFLFL
jgi:hypothetical protein